MARPRKSIARIVGINVAELASHILNMTDAEKAAWLTKAVSDLLKGCANADADPFIKVQYENTMQKIRDKQEYDARRHAERKAITDGVAATREGAGDTTNTGNRVAPESATAPSTISKDAPHGNAGEAVTRAGNGVLLGSATSFNNSKGDASDREAEDVVNHGRNAASLKRTTISIVSGVDAGCRKALDDEKSGTSTPTDTTDNPLQSNDQVPDALLDGKTPSHGGSVAIFEAQQSRTAGGALSPLSGIEKAPVSLAGAALPANSPAEKRPYGTCQHVMLTDAEGHHLREVYGDDLKTAIDILDAYIENNGKAAKRYKNHAAVMRKGNWVWNKIQEMKIQDKRLNNAGQARKSFKQQDREHQSELMHTSLFAPSFGTGKEKRIANG